MPNVCCAWHEHERRQCTKMAAAAALMPVMQCHRPSPPAVTNLAQGLVFGTIGFLCMAAIGVFITYNAYPQAGICSWGRGRCLLSGLAR